MQFTFKNISVVILATVFFAFGSGVTICKMVCLSSGDVQFTLNEEGSCCDDVEAEGCCDDENSSENKIECCTHTDNSLELDQYVPGDKVFITTLNQAVNSILLFNSLDVKRTTTASLAKSIVPPPLPIDDISVFTHLLRI